MRMMYPSTVSSLLLASTSSCLAWQLNLAILFGFQFLSKSNLLTQHGQPLSAVRFLAE